MGSDSSAKLDCWAIVELMGHVKLAGLLTEEMHLGVEMGRIDIPQVGGGYVTQFFGGGSVYRITPTTEAVAREVAKRNQPEPVGTWEVSALLAGPDDDDKEAPACFDLDEQDENEREVAEERRILKEVHERSAMAERLTGVEHTCQVYESDGGLIEKCSVCGRKRTPG